MRRISRTSATTVLVSLLASVIGQESANAAACDEGTASRTAYCLFQQAASDPAAIDDLAALALRSDDAYAWFYLGCLQLDRGEAESTATLRRAADAFRNATNPLWASRALRNLGSSLVRADDFEGAAMAFGNAEEEVPQIADPLARAEEQLLVRSYRNQLAKITGGDLEPLYKEVQRDIGDLPDGLRPRVRFESFELAGNLAHELGRYAEATSWYSRAAAAARELGGPALEANSLLNLATTSLAARVGSRSAIRSELHRAVQLAEEVADERVAIKSLTTLSRLSAGEKRISLVEEALARARTLNDREILIEVLGRAATAVLDGDPRLANQRIDEALSLVEHEPDPRAEAYLWTDRLRVRWETWDKDRARDDTLAVLDSLLRQSMSPPTELTRVQLASVWREANEWVIGQLLLDYEKTADLENLEMALSVSEMARANELEKSVIAREYGAVASSVPVELASLNRTLGPRHALLILLTGQWEDAYGDFAGGSWAIKVSASGPLVFRLPDSDTLAAQVKTYLSLLDAGKPAGPATRALRRSLFGPVLDQSAVDLDHLTIVADGALFDLPFAALAAIEDSQSLPVSIAPSLKLWRTWRRESSSQPVGGVLVVADPLFDAARSRVIAARREWAPEALGRLPHARREGRRVLGALQGHGAALIGESATEAATRDALRTLRPHVLHFATHAVADGQHPDRSAIVLSPVSTKDDGLLTLQEIERWPQGSPPLVVLSACKTARGWTPRSEGPLSLARAFLRGGAHTVVASVLPVEDRATADVMELFYEALAEGKAVSESLAAAQNHSRGKGEHPARWAGLVVLGDGLHVPFPGGVVDRPASVSAMLAAPVVAALLVVVAWGRRRLMAGRPRAQG